MLIFTLKLNMFAIWTIWPGINLKNLPNLTKPESPYLEINQVRGLTWRDPLKCDDLEKIDIFKISIIIGILYAYTALFVIIFRYSYPLLKLKMASNLHHCRCHHFKIYNFVYFSRYRDISRSGDQHQLQLWLFSEKSGYFEYLGMIIHWFQKAKPWWWETRV